MKKRIVVLLIAVVALFVFAGCEDVQMVAQDEVGIANYDLKGKTLVSEEYGYIIKTVTVQVTNNTTGYTTETETKTKIPETLTTQTVTFGSDGTLTYESTTEYLDGADGDYRETSKTTTTTAATTTTTTAYSIWQDGVITGRAGKTTNTATSSGTWERQDNQTSPNDGTTWQYIVYDGENTSTYASLDYTFSTDAEDNPDATGNNRKYTYETGDTYITVSAPAEDPDVYTVQWVREDADGNDVVKLWGVEYTVQ